MSHLAYTIDMHKQKGFTVVELLIVIVVIAILAAITIVAYNGIQSRALDARHAAEYNQANKLILNKKTLTDNYVCPTCTTQTLLATTYGASSLIPSAANVYFWSAIWSNPPDFDKSKLVIVTDDLNGFWICVGYWSNEKQLWVSTIYNDYGDGTAWITTQESYSPLPPD